MDPLTHVTSFLAYPRLGICDSLYASLYDHTLPKEFFILFFFLFSDTSMAASSAESVLDIPESWVRCIMYALRPLVL